MALEQTEFTTEPTDEFVVAGVAERGTDHDPSDLWTALGEYEDDLEDAAVSDDHYGVLFEFDEGGDEFTYLVGREVESTDDLDPELTGVRLPETTYVAFSMADRALDELVTSIDDELLSGADYERIDGPMFQRFEGADHPTGSESSSELYVPVDTE